MARSYRIYVRWTPRDLIGRFTSCLGIDPEDSLAFMSALQGAGATAAADAAPSWYGYLAAELFPGSDSGSGATPHTAVVAVNQPYGVTQDQGYYGGPADPDGGVHYSLRTWVLEHGMDEDAVYPIAKTLQYEGSNFMAAGEEAIIAIMPEEGDFMLRNFLIGLGFS